MYLYTGEHGALANPNLNIGCSPGDYSCSYLVLYCGPSNEFYCVYNWNNENWECNGECDTSFEYPREDTVYIYTSDWDSSQINCPLGANCYIVIDDYFQYSSINCPKTEENSCHIFVSGYNYFPYSEITALGGGDQLRLYCLEDSSCSGTSVKTDYKNVEIICGPSDYYGGGDYRRLLEEEKAMPYKDIPDPEVKWNTRLFNPEHITSNNKKRRLYYGDSTCGYMNIEINSTYQTSLILDIYSDYGLEGTQINADKMNEIYLYCLEEGSCEDCSFNFTNSKKIYIEATRANHSVSFSEVLQYSVLYANNASELTIQCNDAYTCEYFDMFVPDYISGDQNTFIDCRDDLGDEFKYNDIGYNYSLSEKEYNCFGMNIYAIHGFNGMQLYCENHPTNCNETRIHCGPSYNLTCVMVYNETSQQYQCIGDVCTFPTLAPTLAPTPSPSSSSTPSQSTSLIVAVEEQITINTTTITNDTSLSRLCYNYNNLLSTSSVTRTNYLIKDAVEDSLQLNLVQAESTIDSCNMKTTIVSCVKKNNNLLFTVNSTSRVNYNGASNLNRNTLPISSVINNTAVPIDINNAFRTNFGNEIISSQVAVTEASVTGVYSAAAATTNDSSLQDVDWFLWLIIGGVIVGCICLSLIIVYYFYNKKKAQQNGLLSSNINSISSTSLQNIHRNSIEPNINTNDTVASSIPLETIDNRDKSNTVQNAVGEQPGSPNLSAKSPKFKQVRLPPIPPKRQQQDDYNNNNNNGDDGDYDIDGSLPKLPPQPDLPGAYTGLPRPMAVSSGEELYENTTKTPY